MLLAAGARLPAQEVPGDQEVRERWDVAVDLGFNGSSGNTRLTVFTTGFSDMKTQTSGTQTEGEYWFEQ